MRGRGKQRTKPDIYNGVIHMSHLLDMSNNRANMAYVGETPWHGLGVEMPQEADIDQWRIAAGLDWTIKTAPIYFRPENDNGQTDAPQYPVSKVDNRVALYRSDTREQLSIMSENRYNIVQPGDILEFYRELVNGSQFAIETAGSLKGGAKLWALAKCNYDIRIQGVDVISPYLLLATACDGTMSTVADFTSVRVVCNNTLTMAVGANGGKSRLKVPHSRTFDPAAVRAELGLVDDYAQDFERDINTLASAQVSDAQAIEYFSALYAKVNGDGEVQNEKHLKKVVHALWEDYCTGPGSQYATANKTAWGLVNAVTHFQDFKARARGAESRFHSNQFDAGARLKSKAFDSALELVA